MAASSWTWNCIAWSGYPLGGILPDRSGRTFAAWLTTHPGAEIISRDRGGEYAEAARRAAPAAIQVADRFHLLRGRPLGSMRDVVLRIFKRHAKRIAQVVLPIAEPQSLIRLRPDRAASRERTRREMEDRFNAIQQLAAQGMNRSAIARALGLHRHTVQKYFTLAAAPERRHTTRKTSALTPYEGYLLERWRGGCHNAKQLWREVVARGYLGAYRGVALLARGRPLGSIRDQDRAGEPLQRAPTGFTPAGATGIAVMRPEKRSALEQHALAQVGELNVELRDTLALFASFAGLLRERDEGKPRCDWINGWGKRRTAASRRSEHSRQSCGKIGRPCSPRSRCRTAEGRRKGRSTNSSW